MRGLAQGVENIFEKISKLNCIKGYTLIGGTALSLLIDKRLSEDLDFCKWTTKPGKDKPEVNHPAILKELEEEVGNVTSVDVLGFNQANFEVEGVKLSFYANQLNRSPITSTKKILNNIAIPDLETIGAMKLEVMQRRSKFRDYYDLYSIQKEGISLTKMIDSAVRYSGGIIKAKGIAAFISNGENFKNDPDFKLLNPKYDVDYIQVAQLTNNNLKSENPIELKMAIYSGNHKRVKDILSRGTGIINKSHLELIQQMKIDGNPKLNAKTEQYLIQLYKQENRFLGNKAKNVL
jgi:hypothetical protein